MTSGYLMDLATDFELNVGDEAFRFGRTFSISEATVLAGGTGPWTSEMVSPFPRSTIGGPRWLHSVVSMIQTLPGASTVRVLLPEMFWISYSNSCLAASPCFLPPTAPEDSDTKLRLQRLGVATSRRFILIREDGEHWRYEPTPNTTEMSRLVAVEDRLGRQRFTVSYSTPATCTATGEQVNQVTFRNGSLLKFNYTQFPAASMCLLTSIDFKAGSPQSTQTVTSYQYAYYAGNPSDVARYYLSGRTDAKGQAESYSDPTVSYPTNYTAWEPGSGLTRAYFFVDPFVPHSFPLVTEVQGGPVSNNFTIGFTTPTVAYTSLAAAPPANACTITSGNVTPVTGTSFSAMKSPSATPATKTLAYYGYPKPSYGVSMALRCEANGSGGCVAGTATSFLGLGSASGACGANESISTLRIRPGGRYENETAWRATGTAVPAAALGDAVPMYRAKGGNGYAGPLSTASVPLSSALDTTYLNDGEGFDGGAFPSSSSIYDTFGTEPSYGRRFDTIQQVSSLSATARVDRRQEGDLRTGSANDVTTGKTIKAGVTQTATRKTLRFNSRICGTDPGTEVSVSGAAAKVLRIEGPCWWNTSTNACETTEPVPLTEYHYYDPSQAGFKAGRLRYIKRYPNRVGSTCNAPLVTEYADYDAEGHPTSVVDEAGVTTTYSYVNGRLDSRTVGGNTTKYTYETTGQLRSIKYPQGNYLVNCWHTNSYSGFCDFTASLLQRLQWTAKSPNSNGSAATEKQTFEYGFGNSNNPNAGPLRFTKFYDAAGVLRRQVSQYTDADGRVGHIRSGVTGAVSPPFTTKAWDLADNLAAQGGAFANAPELCASGSLSPLCAWFIADRADRLAEVDTHPTGSVSASESIRTCIDYDVQGNIRRVASGCPMTPGSYCNLESSAGAQSSCVQSPIDYDVDDFGDTLKVTGAWRGDAAGKSTTTYEYNARGFVTKKATQSMVAAGTYLLYTYDAADRLLTVSKEGTGGSVLLYALGYDGGNPGTSCPTLLNRGGRLAYRSDSFGVTWYSYDAEGRVTLEMRQRAGSQGSCAWGGSPYINNPHTTYAYSANGNLISVQYPYGRTVTYSYAAGTDRVQSISSTVWDLSTSTPTTYVLVSNIEWEPFGGLRKYQVKTGTTFAGQNTVEYEKGPLAAGDTPASSTNGISCSIPSSPSAPDGTDRTRALLVSATSQGDILRQVYTWAGDQLVRQQTCVPRLGQTVETSQAFTYDKTLRLVQSASTEFPRITAPVNPGANRTYGYDRRGNRSGNPTYTAFTADGCTRSVNFLTGDKQDIFNYMTPQTSDPDCSNRFSGPTILFDADGRAWRKATAYYWWYADLNYSPNLVSSGLDSVVKSVTVNRSGVPSTNFSYRYDAFNRRRLKTYPFDAEEEFFYDVGQQLLTQRSGNVVGQATQYTVDDFVWLDGKPIMMVRGSFSTTFARNLDTQASCNRFGDPGVCGVFHVVHDVLPKPILMMNAMSGKLANVTLYDDFGYANRIPVIAGTGIPASSTSIATVTLPAGNANQSYQARVLYNYVDLPATQTVYVNASAPVTGYNKAQWWSGWTGLASNLVQVTLNSTSCGSDCGRVGLQVDGVEFRRFEVGATPMWTTIRFPGQQFDEETDLHENWNRFYEPQLGQYLSPEPLLQSPFWAKSEAAFGYATPTYAYGRNNPLFYIDGDGLQAHHPAQHPPFQNINDGCSRAWADWCDPPDCDSKQIKLRRGSGQAGTGTYVPGISPTYALALCRANGAPEAKYAVWDLNVTTNELTIDCFECPRFVSCASR